MVDSGTAAMLLGPFRADSLAAAHVKSLAATAERYGQLWTAELLRTSFGGDRGLGSDGDG